MDLSITLLGTLLVLAIVDATSIGTLVVPIWLLLAPRPIRIGRMAVYLATAAAFYLVVGVLLLLGIDVLVTAIDDLAEQRWLRWAQLAVGATMLAWAVFGTSPRGGTGRLRRWRDRIGQDGSVRGLVLLALTVTVVEVATMLPYLAAIGTLSAADVDRPIAVGLLAVYCVVMVLPALVLTLARTVGRSRLDPLLRRVDDWMTRNAGEATGWVVGLVGFYLAGGAAQVLF